MFIDMDSFVNNDGSFGTVPNLILIPTTTVAAATNGSNTTRVATTTTTVPSSCVPTNALQRFSFSFQVHLGSVT